MAGLMEAVGAAEKVFELIDREPKIDHHSGADKPDVLDGLIEFRNVSFAYPTRPDVQVLKNVSFKAHPGEVVALVGMSVLSHPPSLSLSLSLLSLSPLSLSLPPPPSISLSPSLHLTLLLSLPTFSCTLLYSLIGPSGGGKSSCIAMLERFYEPQSGCVLLDGRPLSQYDHTYFHTRVSLVGQEPVLYARSVGENIACNLEGTTQHDIQEAARLANAHDFITAMTDGYNTQTGEKGKRFATAPI